MTTFEAIDKIKKLLRMKRGGTDAEIATALRRALQIAQRHGIDLATVNPDDDGTSRRVGHEATSCGARIAYDHKYAAAICTRFFNVDVIFGDRWRDESHTRIEYVINLVGLPCDREVARYVFIFVCRQFNIAWRTRHGRCRNRQAFIFGMFKGIEHNLEQAQPDATTVTWGSPQEALVLSRRDYIDRTWPKTKEMNDPAPKRISRATLLGYAAGRTTQIRPAVPEAAPAPLQLGT